MILFYNKFHNANLFDGCTTFTLKTHPCHSEVVGSQADKSILWGPWRRRSGPCSCWFGAPRPLGNTPGSSLFRSDRRDKLKKMKLGEKREWKLNTIWLVWLRMWIFYSDNCTHYLLCFSESFSKYHKWFRFNSSLDYFFFSSTNAFRSIFSCRKSVSFRWCKNLCCNILTHIGPILDLQELHCLPSSEIRVSEYFAQS